MIDPEERKKLLERYEKFRTKMSETRQVVRDIREANRLRWQELVALQDQNERVCRRIDGECDTH